MTEDEFGIMLRKMNWIERKIRRWWMQRQLWKSYEKAIIMMWGEYEAALAAKNVELSDSLSQQMLYFRKHFEAGRAAIDAVFETAPRVVMIDE
jgi:hypothetical protein